MNSYFLHSYKKISSLDELERYFDDKGFVRMPPDYVKSIINNPLLHIFHKFFFRKPYRAVANHNLAESIFNIAQVEYLKNKKNEQAKELAYRAALFCVNSLEKNGKYNHNEHNNEDQFALHDAAIFTLINAYNLFKEQKFLTAAKKAADFLLASRFEEKIRGETLFWFPHDTLELNSGKNEFVLNTHASTIVALFLVSQYTKINKYAEGAKKGVAYLNYLFEKKDKNNYFCFDRYLIGRPRLLGCLPTPMAFFSFRKMAKQASFLTKRGFLKRALHQPGPHYHFCNWLYLEVIHQYSSLDESILNSALEYGVWLIKKGFRNKLYIHSDWYFNVALLLAIRRNPKFKKFKQFERTKIGLDPRQFQTLEPFTPKVLQKKKPTDFF